MGHACPRIYQFRVKEKGNNINNLIYIKNEVLGIIKI